jgi:hypothetical protein
MNQLTLCPRSLIKAKLNTLLMQGLANEIPSLRRDMVIILTENLTS